MKITKTSYSFKTKNFHGDIDINGDRDIWIFENHLLSHAYLKLEEKEINELINLLIEAKGFLEKERGN